MWKQFIAVMGISSALALTGCNSSYETPDEYKVKSAMSEWANGETIDELKNLRCDNLGKGKFYCSFVITYIGSQAEHMEKCFFSSASEITIRPNSRCY